MKANINTDEGKNIHVFMGSYGVGLSRLFGAVIEASHDKDGIIWPHEISPWYYNLINLKNGDLDCDTVCTDIYNSIKTTSKTVLYDDTIERAGTKLAKADLIGLPFQIIVGPRGIKEKVFDLKNRKNGNIQKLSYNELINFINSNN
jgi:prolyl-tRNA synthetase